MDDARKKEQRRLVRFYITRFLDCCYVAWSVFTQHGSKKVTFCASHKFQNDPHPLKHIHVKNVTEKRHPN
jgi:hypothetical protein